MIQGGRIIQFNAFFRRNFRLTGLGNDSAEMILAVKRIRYCIRTETRKVLWKRIGINNFSVLQFENKTVFIGTGACIAVSFDISGQYGTHQTDVVAADIHQLPHGVI